MYCSLDKHRFMAYLSDTSSDVEQKQLELLRNMTPQQRFALTARLTDDVFRASKRAIARANPDLSEKERRYLYIELHYGKELADAVRCHEKRLSDGLRERFGPCLAASAGGT